MAYPANEDCRPFNIKYNSLLRAYNGNVCYEQAQTYCENGLFHTLGLQLESLFLLSVLPYISAYLPHKAEKHQREIKVVFKCKNLEE